MMKIIRPDWQPSRPVQNWKEIGEQVLMMRNFIVTNKFEGNWDKAYSLSHCQVRVEGHFAFFVVHPDHVGPKKMFQYDMIVNPEIVSVEEKTKERMEEACMSFPYRTAKKMDRYYVIKVKYQVKGWFGLKIIEEETMGLKAQIFQHEIDHCRGKSIYSHLTDER